MVENLGHKERVLWYCIFVPACLSLLSSLWMLLSYALFPRLQTPTMRLVMLQACVKVVESLVYNVAFFDPPDNGTFLCGLQGWFLNFSVFLSVLSTALIAAYMVRTIERKKKVDMPPRRVVAVVTAMVLFSGGLAAVPFATNQYAYLGARCWIAESEYGRDRRNGVIMRFVVYFGPVWLAVSYIGYCYIRLTRYLRHITSDGIMSSQTKFVHRTISVLLMYPAICLIVWIPSTVLRVISAVQEEYKLPVGALGLAVVLISCEGLLFAIVFSRYRAVRQEWLGLFQRCIKKQLPASIALSPATTGNQLTSSASMWRASDVTATNTNATNTNATTTTTTTAPAAAGKSGPQQRLTEGIESSSSSSASSSLPPTQTDVVIDQRRDIGSPWVQRSVNTTAIATSDAIGSRGFFNAFFGAGTTAERQSLGAAVSSGASQFFTSFADLDMEMPEALEEEEGEGKGGVFYPGQDRDGEDDDDGLELRSSSYGGGAMGRYDTGPQP